MEEDKQPQHRGREHFNIRYFQKWDEFRTTWKSVKFDESLNEVDQKTLILFWEKELQQLKEENQQICILVPNKVNKTEVKEENPQVNKDPAILPVDNTQPEIKEEKEKQKSTGKQGKKQSKNYKKDGKREGMNQMNQVKLNPRVGELAMNLVSKKYPTLSFMYQSLFLGNDKQLLIYRSCATIDSYLYRYRLPNNFKQKFDFLNKAAEEFYQRKREFNLAFSSHAQKTLLEQLLKELQNLKGEVSQRYLKFKTFFISILKDFKANQTTKELNIQAVRSELLQYFQELAKDHELFMSSRFFQTDFDEVKEISITKNKVERQYDYQIEQSQPFQEEKYEWVAAPKKYQTPKDIYDLKLWEMNLVNQKWKWRFFMPKCSKYNQYLGLYLRAPEGEGPAEVTQLIEPQTEYVDIELSPYAIGKIIWEIYTWNETGFTKSTQRIVLYNELKVEGSDSPPLKSYQSWIVGISDLGIRSGEISTLAKLPNKCKDISLYNSAIICDGFGHCASWGQLYFNQKFEDEPTISDTQILVHLQQHQRIEEPFLVFPTTKYIRKVSCGMGYALMLSSLGQLWSFGFNKYGQLGLGHFQSNYQTTEPQQVCKFTGESSHFLTDICATSKGSSFALDEKGSLYRWGLNQVDETHFPIRDRFNTIINYETIETIYKLSTPAFIGKHNINGCVKQIDTADTHYFALTMVGDLYGWGTVENLGIGVLLDTQERPVYDVVNPIQILNKVEFISTNREHTVVKTKDNKILGWGKGEFFSNKVKGLHQKPIDLTEEYINQNVKAITQLKAGVNYTVIVREDNSIQIFGTTTIITLDPQAFTKPIVDIVCSKFEECFSILTD